MNPRATTASAMRERWQRQGTASACEGTGQVLLHDWAQAPFGKGSLVRFRAALIAQTLDRRLIERTVELAEREGDFGPRQLRAALDASPLWGAGRGEDTDTLLGHGLRKDTRKRVPGVIARQRGRELTAGARDAAVALLATSASRRRWTWIGMIQLRQRQQTKAGRAKLRERVAVEHALAHIGHWQGDRARYRGQPKNLFDLRRVAVVHNLHVLMAGQHAAAA